MDTLKPSGRTLARRSFFRMLSAALGMIFLGPRKLWAAFIQRFPIRTVEEGMFHFDPPSGAIISPDGNAEPYALRIDGLVRNPVTLSCRELRSLPYVTRTSDFHCVEGWSVADVSWGGFRFEEILRLMESEPKALHVVLHSLGRTVTAPGGQDHYVESFPVQRLQDPKLEYLLALDMDGTPLSYEHGAPLRLVAPYDLGY